MSLFNEQISQLLENKLKYQDNNLIAQLSFDKEFIGFKGHFPDRAVLPGVVMIKVMTRMYEMYTHKQTLLTQIKKAKFIEPIFEDTLTSFFVKSEETEAGINLQGKVVKSDKIIAKVSLVLQGA